MESEDAQLLVPRCDQWSVEEAGVGQRGKTRVSTHMGKGNVNKGTCHEKKYSFVIKDILGNLISRILI